MKKDIEKRFNSQILV